jgi:PKD repeat protein
MKSVKFFLFVYLFHLSFNTNAQQDTLYVIPVVFHVIHNYGTENISDAQIYDGLNILNRNFRKQHPDTGSIASTFKGIAADCSIEFRLAQKDPSGNCHKGINRIASDLTFTGGHSVKNLIHWPREKYLNIYICADAAGLAGHALMPDQADTIPAWDGIVIQHSYVGSIGTSSALKSMVLTHECGHYLGLQHIWGGNNVPGFYYLPVAQASNCNFDDGISDTPLTIGWQSCNINGTSCGTLDNVQNFMDYSYCGIMFTEGQKQRMRNVLNSTESQRNNLISNASLVSTGTDGTSTLCKVEFSSSKTEVCAGDSIVFYNASYHGATNFLWSFPGGNPALSSLENPVVKYSTPGQYEVSLTASNGTDTVFVTKNKLITVLQATGSLNPFYEDFENTTALPDISWFATNPDSGTTWQIDSSASFSGKKSVKIDNYNNPPGRTDELISSTIDLSNISTVTLSFRYAHARKNSSNNENIKIWISNDCGKTWALRKAIGASALPTVADQTNPFTPQSDTDWTKVEITNITANYLISNFRFKISFTSDGGNNFYLDDIQLNNFPASVSENHSSLTFNISPNPAKNLFYIDYSIKKNSRARILLKDISGKNIAELYSGILQKGNNRIIQPVTVSAGIYLVEFICENETFTKKIVIE